MRKIRFKKYEIPPEGEISEEMACDVARKG
jgi:hypothetical protein